MFEINMSGQQRGLRTLREGRQKIFGIDDILLGGLVSGVGSWLGGKANEKARKNAIKNAYKVSDYQPGLGMQDFDQYNPTPADVEQLQAFLSGNYNPDPEIMGQLQSIAEAGKRMGKTDEEIQRAQLAHFKKMQAKADVYETGLAGAYGEMAGIDPATGKPRGGSFDPRSQASISGFKYMAPALAQSMKNAQSEEERIRSAPVDDVTKERMIAELKRNTYADVTKTKEDQVQAGLTGLGNLYGTARGTQAPGLSGGYGMAAQAAGTAGNYAATMSGQGLQRDQVLAGLGQWGQTFNRDNTQWRIGRNDANRQFLEGNRFNAWQFKEGTNAGSHNAAALGAPQPGSMIGSLAGTVGGQIMTRPRTSRAPGGSGSGSGGGISGGGGNG